VRRVTVAWQPSATFLSVVLTGDAKDLHVRNCKLCGLSKFCNDLPGFCIFLQMVSVVTMVGVLAYLFVTQEMLG
jgi:hypothetical protein